VFDDFSRLNNEFANMQRELARKNAELAHSNEQKNMMLGMAAHDLRNPLGIISAYAEFLEISAGARLTQSELSFLKKIHDSSMFMLHLIEEVLVVSKGEVGKLALDRRLCDYAALVQENIDRNRLLASNKKIALELSLPQTMPGLVIDQGKIEQVLNNLIGNAIKFSYPETRIAVQITIQENSHGMQEVETAVIDQGQGIPQNELPKLFQPFSRTSVIATAGEPSTGLGLAIVKEIIEGHQGRITVQSTPDLGSTFTFILPVV
jgi:signal transduction histidine kinase